MHGSLTWSFCTDRQWGSLAPVEAKMWDSSLCPQPASAPEQPQNLRRLPSRSVREKPGRFRTQWLPGSWEHKAHQRIGAKDTGEPPWPSVQRQSLLNHKSASLSMGRPRVADCLQPPKPSWAPASGDPSPQDGPHLYT